MDGPRAPHVDSGMAKWPRPSTLLLLLLCVGSTAWLVWRERGNLVTAGARPAQGESHGFYAVLDTQGRDVGELEVERRAEDRDDTPGFATRVRSRVRLDLLGAARELALTGDFWIADSGDRAVVVAHAVSDGRALDLDADVENGRLVGTLSTGGEQLPVSFPLPADALVSGAFGTPLALPELEPGVKVSIAGFDPMTLGTGRTELELIGSETLTIAGTQVPVHRVAVRQGAITATVFLDDAGELVRAETPFGLILERRSPGTASPDRPLAAAEVVSLAMVRPEIGSESPPQRGARRLRLVVRGAPTTIPTSSRQRRLADGSFEILAEAPAGGPSTSEPPAPGAHLAAEPLIQSDHPRIRETAAAVVGELTDAWRKAQALADWVFETIDKSPAASVPSAIEVLETKAGDCNEHTVLYTALARAAAIPTRIAIGLVWSDQHQAFAYHAWPEVWIGDRFIAVDPTLGEPIADATHIALLHGGLERWLSLGAWLGAIEIEILEVE